MRIECSDGYYEGDVSYWNEPNGEGTYHWRNGDKFVGEWKNDLRHGKGVYTWKNGDRFEGRWENSVRTGRGVWYYASDGAVVYGEYVNGKWISEK